ncbi:MAG: ABC transporter permease [Candidatus Caldarchaeum sp.]|nr:ABC transporter permease [Candidatus Caldarchaeum sp.]
MDVLTEVRVLTMRELKKWYRSPFLLVFTLVQPVLWMGLFGKAFNLTGFLRIPNEILDQLPPAATSQIASVFNSILTRFFGRADIDYFSYISLGMLSITVLFTSMSSGMGIAWDRRLGFLNKLLAAPIWRGSIIVSKVLATVVRSVLQASLLLLLALALGARFNPLLPLGPLIAVAALCILAVGLSSFSIAVGLRLKSWESQAAVMNLLNLPLMFASNALYPVSLMPPWLQTIALANPISYAVDAVRQTLLLGQAANTAILITDMAAVSLFAAFFTAVGTYLAGTTLKKT